MRSDGCKTKRNVSEKMRAANQANALKSTGPVTDSGKYMASKNALKHGMRAQTFLTPELEIKVEDAFVKWKDQLSPLGVVEDSLIKQAVCFSVKFDWLDTQFNLVVAEQTRRAGNRFDNRERKGAALEAEGLVADPAATVGYLKNSIAGCNWLIDEWKALDEALPNGLDDDKVAQALRLMGIDPSGDLTQGQSNVRTLFVGTQTDAERRDGPDGEPLDVEIVRTIVHSIIDEAMVGLTQYRDVEVSPVNVQLRRQSQATAMLPQGKNGALWPRYQGMNTRGFHQALNDLLKIRTHDDPPRPNDFRRAAPGDRAPNEAVRDANLTDFTTDSDGYHSAPAAEWAAKDQELERLSKKLATAEFELDMVRGRLARKASASKADGSTGTIAPNEAVSTPQVPNPTAVPLNRPSVLGQVMRVAMCFVAFLLGARTLGAGKVGVEVAKAGKEGNPESKASGWLGLRSAETPAQPESSRNSPEAPIVPFRVFVPGFRRTSTPATQLGFDANSPKEKPFGS